MRRLRDAGFGKVESVSTGGLALSSLVTPAGEPTIECDLIESSDPRLHGVDAAVRSPAGDLFERA